MQVKMKLVNLGHAQTEETRKKIGVGVRMGWKRRRAKLLVQETCCFEWQNLIAEASRKGYGDEEELQWDSFEMLNKQLEQEWLESIEQRKSMPRPKGNRRAPKSPEQRRKISEAISAKWNDPEYRERVCSALEKYHGTPVGTQKQRPRRNPSENSESPRSPVKRKVKDDSGFERNSQARSRPKRRAPKYKDPLADSKLEMIKNIRAQRMAMETKKIEAVKRARLLITEAEKAAKTLEEAALTSPLARASLIETRKLIAEATRSIEAVETGQITSFEKDSYSSSKFNGQVNRFGEETDGGNGDGIPPNMKEPNGIHVPFLQNNGVEDLDLGKTSVQDLINHEHHEQTRNNGNSSSPFQANILINQIGLKDLQLSQLEANGAIRNKRAEVPNGEKTVLSLNGAGQTSGITNPTKKWVCGRLVEVSDSTSENDKTLGQE
ncbi:hypothetical protein AQUCO_01300901v1 [Aquilegia coerulea]|uniref:Nuclease associated modular domain-containing protein n=1 Tax=Aquilegia coerulea TaxID=218851 RepID=A0A2G5E410_AQUCA|nr:hypothetical protein AQUCO_01300901v1 [Aquilegia coerulea]